MFHVKHRARSEQRSLRSYARSPRKLSWTGRNLIQADEGSVAGRRRRAACHPQHLEAPPIPSLRCAARRLRYNGVPAPLQQRGGIFRSRARRGEGTRDDHVDRAAPRRVPSQCFGAGTDNLNREPEIGHNTLEEPDSALHAVHEANRQVRSPRGQRDPWHAAAASEVDNHGRADRKEGKVRARVVQMSFDRPGTEEPENARFVERGYEDGVVSRRQGG